MKRRLIFAVFALLSSPARSEEIMCPEQITEQSELAQPVEGWVPLQLSHAKTLRSIGVYLGNPVEMAELVPDETDRQASVNTDTWHFTEEEKGKFWVACNYNGSSLVLARNLSKTISSCQARYELLPSGQVLSVIDLTCR